LQHYLQSPSYGNSLDAPLLTNGLRKCGTYTQRNFIQPERRMKFCHSQVNGCNWRTVKFSEGQAQKAKISCSPSYVDDILKTSAVILWTWHILRGEHAWEE
jgi:hypothetical protein